MAGQRGQESPFMLESLGRNETGLALGPLFHPHGGPLQGLAVEVLQILESAARNKIGFDGQETAFFACLAIGVFGSMAQETKAVSFGEGFHLRNDHRLGAQAAPARQIGVVNNTKSRRVTPMAQSQVQETLEVKTIEAGVELQIPALGVTQVKQAGLQPQPLCTH